MFGTSVFRPQMQLSMIMLKSYKVELRGGKQAEIEYYITKQIICTEASFTS